MNLFNDKIEHEMMGVINFTPDSFSDGGESIVKEELLKKLELFKSLGCRIFDFGAESTAPMNSSLTKENEIQRFNKYFYPLLEEDTFSNETVFSIDTYRPDVFCEVRTKILTHFPNSEIYFNDVSGHIPEDISEIMSSHDKTLYIFSHNLSPSREEISQHIEYTKKFDTKEDLLFELINHFSNASFKFMSKGISDRVVFDPCFGFSKNEEQNIWLLEILGKLVKTCSIETSWLIGISRKKFMQAIVSKDLDLTKEEAIKRSEYYHTLVLSKYMKTLSRNKMTYRVHDPVIFDVAKRSISHPS